MSSSAKPQPSRSSPEADEFMFNYVETYTPQGVIIAPQGVIYAPQGVNVSPQARSTAQLANPTMSSSSTYSKELYEAERLRNKTLEKKVARLEADNKGLETQVKTQKAQYDEKLEGLEAQFDLKEEAMNQQLQAKDITIEKLQMVLNNANRSISSDNVKKVEELQAEVDDLNQKLVAAAMSNWDNVAPFIDQDAQNQIDFFAIKADTANEQLANLQQQFENLQQQFENSQQQFESVEAENNRLHAYNNALKRQFHTVRLEGENVADIHASRAEDLDSMDEQLQSTLKQLQSRLKQVGEELHESLMARRSKEDGSITKLRKACAIPKIKSSGSLMKSRPTQDVGLQSSSSLSSPPPSSLNPTEAPNSPAELEILRLKDRQTLHRLAPF